MFPEPNTLSLFSTIATEVVIALLLGLYLVNDVRRKQDY